MKKIIFLLAICLISSMSFAEIIESGNLNENITWTLDSDSTLMINGEGDISSYPPWCSYSITNKIKQIIVSEGITSVSSLTCGNYNNVSSVQLPNSLKTIGYCAIGACNVKSVTIPENVTTIEGLGFYKIGLDTLYYNAINCVVEDLDLGLKIVFIGKKVTRIPEFLFGKWNGLEQLTVLSNNPSNIIVEENVFKYVDNNIPIYVPKCAIEAYQTSEGWNKFTNFIGIESELCEERTNIAETKCMSDEIVGYYSLMGTKLSEEPENGLYIILYSNGQIEKRIKK